MEKEYKYNLNKFLNGIERGLAIGTIEKMITKNYGIPAVTFRKDRAIEKNSSKSIKEERLAAYAAFFNTTQEKLRNYELPTTKSLKQLKSQTARSLNAELENEIGFRKLA